MPRKSGAASPDRSRPNIPVALQVANHLRRQIRREYAAGGRLPSENEIATQMDVSRGTVRQALAILQHEGLISRHQGLGTFANPNVPGIPARIDFAYEFVELINSAGYRAEVRTLEKGAATASEATANKLDLKPGAPLLFVRKLYLADGQPAIYETDWLPTGQIVEDYDPRELEQPIWHFLERRCHRQTRYVLSELLPVAAEGEVAAALQLAAQQPLLKFDEIFYSGHNEPLAQAMIYFREPLFRFHALRKVLMAI